MVKYTFLVVGKIKEKYFTEAIKEYSKRMSKYAKIQFVEIEDKSDKNVLSIDLESNEIISKIPNRSYTILLDIKGQMLDSIELANKLQKITLNYTNICFIIGGSNGVSSKVKEIVDYKLSFSNFTFPHQLMRVVLLEQVYRSICIQNNIKYHK